MVFARFGIVLLLVSAAGIAKPPADTPKPPTDKSSVCDRFQRSDIIFTGSAESPYIALFDAGKSPIHKRSEKSKRVRFLVREWYKGQRHDLMDIWITPDCPLKIEANEMYVIYARLNKDNERIETSACMGTVPVASAGSDLSYLNASLQGPGRATRISGTAGGPNVNVQAKSGIDIRYAITDATGKFAFEGLRPGDWGLSLVGGTPQPVQLAPNSCVVQDLK